MLLECPPPYRSPRAPPPPVPSHPNPAPSTTQQPHASSSAGRNGERWTHMKVEKNREVVSVNRRSRSVHVDAAPDYRPVTVPTCSSTTAGERKLRGEAGAGAAPPPPELMMSARGFRRPYARQRRESDEGEEEGFLYCLMYYFGEYLKGLGHAGHQGMLSVLCCSLANTCLTQQSDMRGSCCLTDTITNITIHSSHRTPSTVLHNTLFPINVLYVSFTFTKIRSKTLDVQVITPPSNYQTTMLGV
ncbi:hypothetical protein E2C01_041438 [Portunus trituberculatus]|uniref:Uncharacterized protein n=1 Tax=Portunus trituberculatus TaxID=210409 RepID=A0A5B7FTK1_PORTR|nr:hypothetical protein [Portunus trituberculatus]